MSQSRLNSAVFLDRDGVIIHDNDPVITAADMVVMGGVPEALARLHRRGYRLIVISNQTVISRGLLDEEGVRQLNRHLQEVLRRQGSPRLDGWYFCPHHPKATLLEYRVDCACRKPKPGLLFQAAEEHQIDLSRSYFVGDRRSDIQAGKRAGCRSIWVQSGMHTAPPIESAEVIDVDLQPDYTCLSLAQAAVWILQQP